MEILLKYFTGFTEAQLDRFAALQGCYAEWNQKINVISRKDMDDFYLHHVLHSLAIATQVEWGSGMQVMDLGCGGGFPGLPLAIFFPEVRFVLVDSIGKKLKVVEAVATALDIKNVEVRHTRAESIRDLKFDAVVSRAVAPLGDLWRWSRPLLRRGATGGGLFCLKGGDLTREIAESGTRPSVWELQQIFREPWFQEKYLLQVKG
jgi:16S rRNA (guanine527-N7)-methyltransferase